MDWEEILSDYNNAKAALWGTQKNENWHREEEKGRYYMWSAYHKACENEPKDYLLFARILAMTANECQFSIFNDYYIYHKYVEPSIAAYALAKNSGQNPTEKELKEINFLADSLKYELDSEEAPYEEQIKYINGYEKLNDFEFHDSKPIYFELTDDVAKLKLEYGNIIATFVFRDIYDIRVEGDPTTSWIMDFYCYPCFHNKNLFTFDVGYYKIVCSSVFVENVEKGKI